MSKKNSNSVKAIAPKLATSNAKRRKVEAALVEASAVAAVEVVAPVEVVAVDAFKLETHARGIHYSTTRPGTISAMLEILIKSSPAGASKQEILDYCITRCGKCAMATVQMQVPSGLMFEKGIEVLRGPVGYYVTPEEFGRYSQAVRSGSDGMTMKQYAALRMREKLVVKTFAANVSTI